MVYLIKSDKSNRQLYDSWLCGGAIVSSTHILTSAACLADVTYLYAIAGYNKYVRSENLDQDECTRERKQKVVKTCVPIKYKMNYEKVYQWAYMDIGFAIVEKPYDFSDVTYRRHCSYVPAQISINFDPQYEADNTDAMVYGWGHNFGLRLPGDYQDYNQEYLRGTTTKIAPRSYCNEHFKNLSHAIENYLICCNGAAYIDEAGTLGQPEIQNDDGCGNRRDMKVCGDYDYDYDFDSRRNENNTTSRNKTDSKHKQIRRQGVFCQNDHGGPLVTWVGSEEYVVGVAITSLYSNKFKCIAPQIFSSTVCASMFIKCVLHYLAPNVLRRKMCENMGKDVGYEIHETEIDWNKIDGNAHNEEITVKNLSSTSENYNILTLNQNNTENYQNDANNNVEKENTRTNEENQNKQVDVRPLPTNHLNYDAVVEEVVVI